jgi:hypothetical protein
VYEATHTQLVFAVLVLGDTVFAGHGVQAVEPLDDLYVDTPHAAHGPPSAPE